MGRSSFTSGKFVSAPIGTLSFGSGWGISGIGGSAGNASADNDKAAVKHKVKPRTCGQRNTNNL
jgi:hypothetical protein